MAGIYNGHLLEFPFIRVDCFTPRPSPPKAPWKLPHPSNPALPDRAAPNAQLYLLTHVHTDHLTGLGDDFTGHIICSLDTKRMLLRLEAERERSHRHHGVREVKKRKYEGLCARQSEHGVVDYIETLNPGESKVFDLCVEEVCITLLDANHCPGSSMFLITTPTKAVLHTGDVRADRTFRLALRRVPQLQEFFVPSSNRSTSSACSPCRRLDRIYIDTSAMLGTGDMPDKEPVLEAMVAQMSLYPPETVFFLNVWCFGWEDVVKEVARHFDTLVHVDSYKRSIYGAVKSDPFLLRCTTEDSKATRFHACERYHRCDECKEHKGKLVVQVQMVEVKSAAWDLEQEIFLTKLNQAAVGEGPWPLNIDVPIARHSVLPELQELVKMFRPGALSPNTLIPDHQGLDYFVFPDVFKSTVSAEADRIIRAERDKFFCQAPKFGPEWLRHVKQIPSFLLDLQPERPLEAETTPQLSTGSKLPPQSETRSTSAADQVARLAGWSASCVASARSNTADAAPSRQISTVKLESQLENKTVIGATVKSEEGSGDLPHTTTTTSSPPRVPKSRSRPPSRFSVNRDHLRSLTDSK